MGLERVEPKGMVFEPLSLDLASNEPSEPHKKKGEQKKWKM